MSSSSAKGTCTASWQVTSRTITRPALISPSTRMHPTGGQSSRRDPARSSRFPKSVVYIIATFGGRRSRHETGRSSRHTTSLLHSGRWPSSAGEPYPTGTDPVENRPGRGWRQPLCLTGFPASAGFSDAHGRSRNEPNGVSAKDSRHQPARTHHHWGRAVTELTFGGRRVQVGRPRVRGTHGGEALLPSVARFRDRDPLTARMMQQLLAGVSTRQY